MAGQEREPVKISEATQLGWSIGELNKNKEVEFLLKACLIISPDFDKGMFWFSYANLRVILESLTADIVFPLAKREVSYMMSGENILYEKIEDNENNVDKTNNPHCCV